MESSNLEDQSMAQSHDESPTIKSGLDDNFEEVDDGSCSQETKGKSDLTALMDATPECTPEASGIAEPHHAEDCEATEDLPLSEDVGDRTAAASPKAAELTADKSSSTPIPEVGNILEDDEESMQDALKTPEAAGIQEGEVQETSLKGTDDDMAGAGLEHKMEAMFGDESSSDELKTGKFSDKPTAAEADELKGVDVSENSKAADAEVDASQTEKDENPEDDEMEGGKEEKPKLNQAPDESNLEFMMEALHADKLSETETSVPKQSDTPGMELKDVLQALTGDHDGDENVQQSTDAKTKNSKKAGNKSKKTSDQSLNDSDDDSSTEQSKKKVPAASTSKRVLRKTRSQSIEKAPSDESDDETMESELKSKIKKEMNESVDSEDEDDSTSTPVNRSTRNRTKQKSSTGKSSGKNREADLVSKSNKVCILPHCRQRCYPQLGISLHRFPFTGNPMRNIWLKLVEQKPPGPTTAYICSKHFTNDDYYNDKEKKHDQSHLSWRKLKPKAFPTVNLAVSYRVIEEIRRKFHTAERILEARKMKAAEKETKGHQKPKETKGHQKPKDTKEQKSSGSKGKEVEKEPDVDHLPRSLRSASASTPVTSKASKSTEEEAKDSATPSSSQPTPKAASIKKRLESDTKPRAPGTNCSVLSCGNNLFKTRADGLNISYYRFPFNDDLAQKWIKKIGDPDLNSRTARICSDHFSEKDFEGSTGGKKNLKPKAVPSLYLTEKKPRQGDSDNDDSDDDNAHDRKKTERKKKRSSKRLDTSAIIMPLPMIPEPEIKSEPPSDEEDVGQEYVAEDTTADEDLLKEIEAAEQKVRNTRSAAKQESTETPILKRPRGRPRKILGVSQAKADKLENPKIKTVTLSSLDGPKITLEQLSHRVIKAAESGSLRVRIKESPISKPVPHQKPCPKSKKKRPIESEESSDDEPKQNVSPGEAEKLKKIKKPGPLSKKRKLLEKMESQEKRKAQVGRASGTSVLKGRKAPKTSDDEEEDADDPAPMSPGNEDDADPPSSKSPSIVKVKPAELPRFLVDKKSSAKGSLKRKFSDHDDPSEDVDSILDSNVSEHQKIAKLVEQRISEHTKIIDQRSMGPHQLVDHNKILQGSALVLKKLAEKTGRTLPASQIIPLNVPENTSVTPGRTIVLKKVSDPGKLGLKPPTPKRGDSSKLTPNVSLFKSSPTKTEVLGDETPGSVKPCSPLEKIRDYDNLMRKYLNAVADKSLVSRKFMEAKESQRTLETKLEEKEKELELVKKKVSVAQTRLNKIVSSLEHFLTPNQIKLALQETKKVAWTPEEMLMAFTIKHLSKACYLFLRHKLNYPLPGISSLQRWMGMLHKDKGEDDEDNIADEDAIDKDEISDAAQQRDETGVMNEITGTLEEINASSVQANKDEIYVPKIATTMTDELICPSQSSPFQIVYENDSSGQGTRKVVIVKKVLNVGGENKAKSKLQISASENDVNVNNISGTGSKNEIYKMLPRAKTISMGGSAGASPSPQPKRVRYVVTKNAKEKEKLSFNRLPKVRQETFQPKPPRIQVVKTEPEDSMRLQNESLLQNTVYSEQHSSDMVDVNEMAAIETIVKPEDVISHTREVLAHQSIEEGHKQIFTLSDLAATQGETIVESVDVEGGVDHEIISAEQLIQSGELETITIMKEDGQFEQHQIRRQDAMGQQTFGASGLEQLVHMATSEEQQQITFATHVPVVSEADGGVTPGEHYAQIAFAATQGSVPGEITLHEDMNNMTAVVINDIDEEQLNTLLMSNVVEQKDVTVEEAAAAGYQHKEIVYQTITDDKNVIVLQPDSQAFVEEDEGPARQTYSEYHRVFIVDEDGCLVPEENLPVPRYPHHEVQDDNLVADFGFKFNDPTNPYSIHNLIENFAIRSPSDSPMPR